MTSTSSPDGMGRPRDPMAWDPQQYARFADHRGRPFVDLLARVRISSPACVVDLGCGDGSLTMSMTRRWPGARVVGVDASPQMLATAQAHDHEGRVQWLQADLRTWEMASLGCAPDVVVSNAALHWVPGHVELIAGWLAALAPGGWFAMHVPGNRDAPSHRLMREVAADHTHRDELLEALSRPAALEPGAYLRLLAGLGCDVDVWETTYLHVLDPEGRQDSPVLEWVRGTGLRPVLEVLSDPDERAAYLHDYDARLRAAYPRTEVGVVLPFRRIFAVAHAKGGLT